MTNSIELLRKLKARKLLLLLSVLIIGVLILVGCTSTSTIPRGWSGPVIAGGKLFLASMEGKFIGIDLSSRNRLFSDLHFEVRSTGGFGCSSGATAVAIYSTPAIGKDLIYIGGYDGKIYAVNSATGALRWVYPRESYLQPIVGGVVQASNMIFFGSSDGKVYALDAETGDFKWGFQTGDKIWATPVVEGDTLYIGSFDKKIYALKIADGSQKWEPFATGGVITAAPVVRDNILYFGSFDRYIYAVNASDGSQKWKSSQAGNWFWSNPIVQSNAVWVGSLDNKLYSFKADSGEKLAEFDLGSPISSNPILVDNSIVVATKEGRVYSINTSDNARKDLTNLQQAVYAPLAANNGVIYIHTDQDNLFAVDAQSGATLWMLPLKT